MCGRFLNTHPSREIALAFRAMMDQLAFDSFARWNIAPSQPIRAVREVSSGRELAAVRWGFVPRWAKSPDDVQKPINARAESVATSRMFGAAFTARRCVIPASGFYEWQKVDGQRTKQPFAIVPTDEDGMFAFAGVWERWGDELETCAILTTTPNAVMEPIHDRMPVILTADAVDEWLAPDTPKDRLAALLRPNDPATMRAFPVSRRVNSPQNDDPGCLEPAPPPASAPDEGNFGGGTLFQLE